MSKLAVIYWSGTGNTEAMAQAVVEGAREAGADASLFSVDQISAADAAGYDRLALGCPAMGAEVLEEGEFEPFFEALSASLSGKRVALFGSYGWGDGQWMRDWYDRADAAGAVLQGSEGLICNEAPDEDALASCRALGRALAG
ncbi:flavodoxin [Pseudoflavonifractor capillosus]|uniref:Flavodoxin n=1 Tax=Pseudoflavonifractor capillosus TaxID=106588 RepID=A0A921MNG6_9FIRM|nr:flavodoxin [Pseudoflavonifractor capillosus]HJG87843.1 flavodoxin [Pseudoflavonifractor capillosus]